MDGKNSGYVLTELNKLELRKLPMPKAKPGEVLIKVGAIGVCGSDVHYYNRGKIGDFIVEFPFILGHECAGTVVEVGEGVHGFEVGDRVVPEPGVPCGKCEMCKTGHYNLCPDVRFLATPPVQGCLMEYLAFPAEYVFKLPDNLSMEQGALVEPMAIGMNAAVTGGIKPGDTVMIFGAGCIGLVSLLAAKACGAAKVLVSDIIPLRLETALKLGASAVIEGKDENVPQKIEELTGGRGADVVLDCAGFGSTIRDAVMVSKPAGKVVLVGMGTDTLDGVPLSQIQAKELEVVGIFRYKNMYSRTIAAISDGLIDINGIISHRFSFSDTPEAFTSACKRPTETIKNVILFD